MSTSNSWHSTSNRNRFEIRKLLGAGGMGSVFLAHDRTRRQDVALKTLSQLNGRSVYRLKQEFRSLANIVHENLVTLYELLVLDENWFFTMTHVDGVSFLEYVRPYSHLLSPDVSPTDIDSNLLDIQDPVSLSKVLASTYDTYDQDLAQDETADDPLVVVEQDKRLLESRRSAIRSAKLNLDRLRLTLPQLATGMHALHQAGKLHRDIKPNNILVSQEGQVYLCDFGLVVDTSTTGDSQLGGGTPAYMSPEQVSKQNLSPASDWYAFGIVLYEALTGHLPFEGSKREALKARCQADGPSPSSTGLEIPSDLNELCKAMLTLDPQSRPRGEQVLEILGCKEEPFGISSNRPGNDAASFVGRQKQQKALQEAYDLMCKGHNVAACVHGPSGIGKSLLIEHFLEQVGQREEVMILKARCYERESVPFKALDSLVDGLCSTLLELPEDRRQQILPRDLPALARLFPSMQQLSENLIDTTIGIQDAQEIRYRAFSALRYLLRMLALDRPTVIYIDDLQWGDMDSAPFLVDLVHHPQAPPLLLIASYRSEEAQHSKLIQKILNPGTGIWGDLRDIPLNPFDDQDAEHLALQLMGKDIAEAKETVASIVLEARGNPMFISELALSVREFGVVNQNLKLDDVIHQRVQALQKDARELLTAAAVAARPLPVQVLSQALDLKDEASTLVTLQAKRMIRTRRVAGVEEVETYHDRIRESTATRLKPAQQVDYNRKLAAALESWGQAEPIALVQFWQKAGQDDKAGHYAELAADDATRSLAFDRAAYYYQIALELKKDLTRDQRLSLCERQADSLADCGALLKAAQVYQEAAKNADPFVAVDLQRKALEQLLRTGTLKVDAQLANTVLNAVGIEAPHGRIKAILSFLWKRLRLRFRGLHFESQPVEQIDPKILQKIDVCWSVASALPFVQPLYGFIIQTQMTSLALDAGDPYRIAIVLTQETSFLSTGGTPKAEEVRDLIAYAKRVAYYSQNPTAIAFANATEPFAHFLIGEFRSAEILSAATSRELRNHSSLRWAASIITIFRMSVLPLVGEIRKLTEEMPALLQEADETGNRYLSQGLRKWRSNVLWLMLDDPDEAYHQAGEYTVGNVSGINFHVNHYYEVTTHIQILLYRGDGVGAWAMMEDAIPRMKKSLIMRIQTIRIEVTFAIGRCALAAAIEDRKNRSKLIKQAARCIKKLDKEDARWSKALAALLRASLAVVQGHRAQAIDLFLKAEAHLQAADLRLFAQIARLRRGQLEETENGLALVNSALDWMQKEAIRNPNRLAALYAPCQKLDGNL